MGRGPMTVEQKGQGSVLHGQWALAQPSTDSWPGYPAHFGQSQTMHEPSRPLFFLSLFTRHQTGPRL